MGGPGPPDSYAYICNKINLCYVLELYSLLDAEVDMETPFDGCLCVLYLLQNFVGLRCQNGSSIVGCNMMQGPSGFIGETVSACGLPTCSKLVDRKRVSSVGILELL